MIARTKDILICVLLGVSVVVVGNVGWNVRLLTQELRGASQNIKNSTARADQYLDQQLDLIQSDAYQKSLKASFDTGAVYNATGRLINTQIIPRAMKDLDRADGFLAALTVNSERLSTLIANTDRSVNQSLLPQATSLLAALTDDAEKFGLSVVTFDRMLIAVSEKANLALSDIVALVGSPEWHDALKSVAVTAENVALVTAKADLTMESIRLAMERAPSIAESVDKIAKTSSKYQRALLIVGIIGTLARAFIR